MAVENLPLGQTTEYSVQMAHSHHEGLYVSPVAGPSPQNASIVRLHAPMEMLTVHWTAVSKGKPPLVPSHKSYVRNGNRLFLSGERYGVMVPSLAGHVFYMAGQLVFAIVAPEDLDSPFCLAKCPWEQSSVADFVVPAANFLDSGIVNPNWQQPIGILPDPLVGPLEQEMVVRTH